MSHRYVLDGHKACYHLDRVKDLMDGKRVAPISIDWALTQACPYNCIYCFAKLQKNPGQVTEKAAKDFLTDAAEIGVLATTLTGDGESTMMPFYYDIVSHGKDVGLDMATATCGYPLKKDKLPKLLDQLTYLRFNISGGDPKRYCEIHGVPLEYYNKVMDIIKTCVKLKKENGYNVTLGLQMVLMPEFGDQVIPLAKLGRELGVDYTVIKHCSDDEEGHLGVNYQKYQDLYNLLNEAETYSTDDYQVKVKWSKIRTGRNRRYSRCYGAPLMIQISGTGLVAPCGPLFNPTYERFQIGNINTTRFKDLFNSDKYWEIMNLLSSEQFDARKDCAHLCLQDKLNEFLWDLKCGELDIKDCKPSELQPEHINFL